MSTPTIPAKTPKVKINNTDALKESGLKVVHVNYTLFGGRGVTIAYEKINKSHYRIATAVCHKSDTFSRKVGTQTALKNFAAGNTVIIPADKIVGPATQFRGMFGPITG